MPTGHIQDPKGNQTEQRYGILADDDDGHLYLYLKDRTNRSYTHSTPVFYERSFAQLSFGDNISFPIEVCRRVRVDEKRVGPLTDRLNREIASMISIGQTTNQAKPSDWRINEDIKE